jgi:arylsulfatase A-like enzyme
MQRVGSKLSWLPVVVSSLFAHPLQAAADSPLTSEVFNGRVASTAKESVPDWPQPIRAPKGSPNILLILLDDIGFADTSTFGGLAQTPELDRLAAKGIRYNNFNTAAMCSPTRAALLTGRNHHRVGFGMIADLAGGYPGYNAVWKQSTASVAEVLREAGYSTAAFGKWHNTPDWEISPIGPFDRWPTGLGFEYFYGFMGPAGDENQWEPSKLYRGTVAVDPPATAAHGYHLTTDITNEAIQWLHVHDSFAPEKPYFLYFATGAVHIPHHVGKEWIEKYRGKFDQGWDKLREETFVRQLQLGVIPRGTKLTPRPRQIPSWDSLSKDRKTLYARQMEIYAGFIAQTDYEVGRLLKEVQAGPHADNTLILYVVGDNGPCACTGLTESDASVQEKLQHFDELGGPLDPDSRYAVGWAWAGSTPFQWMKAVASHFGATRDPLIISWPARIKDDGGARSQFTHVTDIVPTIYDVAGITPPAAVNGVAQQKMDGFSFAATFDDPRAAAVHRKQYFELWGNRAIYSNGWVAAALHRLPWEWAAPDHDYGEDRWELYRVADDFSEAHDLATKYPDKLEELRSLFDLEASENDVYPLGAGGGPGEPSPISGKRSFVFYAGVDRVPASLVPNFRRFQGKSYRFTADAIISDFNTEGVIVAYGDGLNGFTLYVKDNHLVYENTSGSTHDILTARTQLPRARVTLGFKFLKTAVETDQSVEGTVRLLINGKVEGEMRLTRVTHRGETLGIGRTFFTSMNSAFAPPFKFTGTLQQVKLELE